MERIIAVLNYHGSGREGITVAKYKVKIIFDRLNPITKKMEKETYREGVFSAVNAEAAKELYLKQFRRNEPTRRRIRSVKVEEVKD